MGRGESRRVERVKNETSRDEWMQREEKKRKGKMTRRKNARVKWNRDTYVDVCGENKKGEEKNLANISIVI